MKKIFSLLGFLWLLTTYYLLLPHEVGAVCPVCTIAVGAGLGLSRYLGIDDSITGIWVGGLLVSLTFWTADWINKKRFKPFQKSNFLLPYILSSIFYILITFPPLFLTNIIGHPYNTILGLDKLIFGSLAGASAFLAGVFADRKIRKIKGKQLFNYQKVALPITLLVIASLLVYYYGGYLQ